MVELVGGGSVINGASPLVWNRNVYFPEIQIEHGDSYATYKIHIYRISFNFSSSLNN